MIAHLAFGAATLSIAGAALAQPVAKLDVPIMIGGNSEFDACGGYGEIAELKSPDNFLSVRSGPGGSYRELDRLTIGDKVFVCADKSAWVGIVYPASADRDCKVGSPWPKRRAYTGPCKRGWIHGKFLKMLAG